MDFEVGTTSVVGDVIILEATVRFHPTTIFFNGIPFIRKELLDAAIGVGETETLDLGELDSLIRPSAKSKDSVSKHHLSANSPPSRHTSGEISSADAELLRYDADSPMSQNRKTGSSSSSIPPPPPDDSSLESGDLALFCAVCGIKNEKLESMCTSCGSSLRISVLDPELGEQIARRLTGQMEEKASPTGSTKKQPPPPPPLKLVANGSKAHLRANSPTREPPEVPTKRGANTQDTSKSPLLRPAKSDLETQAAKLKAVEDAVNSRRAEAREKAVEEAATAAASSDGDDEKQSLRTRRGNATKKNATLPRSSSAIALSSFKKLETRKAAELIALTGIPRTGGKPEEEKQEPTIFKPASEFTDKDVGCFTVSIKNTSREDHVYYHIVVTTCTTSWVLKKRESDMMDLWNTLHENKVPDLPPRPRRTTGLGRRSGEELVKRMYLLHEMLEGILKNKRALNIRATSLFLELYRALLPN